MKKKENFSPTDNATLCVKEKDKKKRKLHIINLDFITERLNNANSLFDKIASLYGNRNIFIKLAEGAGILGGATLLGALLGQAIIFGLLISLIYMPCAFFLSEHYASMVKKNEQIREDLVELKKNQEASVDQLYAIEEKLEESFTSCAEKTDALSQKTAALEEQASKVNEETSHLIETRQELHQTNVALSHYAQKLETTIQKVQSTVDVYEPTLLEDSKTLQNIYQQSTMTTHALQEDHEHLIKLNADLSSTHAKLSMFSKKAGETLARLQKELGKQETLEKKDTEQPSSEPIALFHGLDTEQVLAKAARVIQESKKQREDNVKFATTPGYKTRLQPAEEEALIQRALNASLRPKGYNLASLMLF